MQHIFIVTKIERLEHSVKDAGVRLFLTDYQQKSIVVVGVSGQQINIQSLQSQVFPLVMLSDQKDLLKDGSVQIPSTSLIGIAPIGFSSVQAALDAGRAEEMIKRMQGE